jgi:hypothetical protein
MKYTFKTSQQQKEYLPNIALKMLEEGFPYDFVEGAMHLAMRYEEIYDLFALWDREADEFEKAELATCIQEALDDGAE